MSTNNIGDQSNARQSYKFDDLLRNLDSQEPQSLTLSSHYSTTSLQRDARADQTFQHDMPEAPLAKQSGSSKPSFLRRLFSSSLRRYQNGTPDSAVGAGKRPEASESVRKLTNSPEKAGVHSYETVATKSPFFDTGNASSAKKNLTQQEASSGKFNAVEPLNLSYGSSSILLQPLEKLDTGLHVLYDTGETTNSPVETLSIPLTHSSALQLRDRNRNAPAFSQIRDSSPGLPNANILESVVQVQTSVIGTGSHADNTAPETRAQASVGEEVPFPGDQPDLTEVLIKAIALYEWQDTVLNPEDYAAYLGTKEAFNEGVRKSYFGLFDFKDMSLVAALRFLCSKLYIRGETQAIDRLLESFATRWWTCNPHESYITKDIAYIIAFALITLNTDLHVANLESDQRMRRAAFVQNTLQAIDAGASDGQTESVPRPVVVRQSTSTSIPLNRSNSELTESHSIRFVPRSVSTGTMMTDFKDGSDYNAGSNQTDGTLSPSQQLRVPPPLMRKISLRRTISSGEIIRDPNNLQFRNICLKEVLQDMYLSVRSEQIRQPQFGKSLNEDSSAHDRYSMIGNDAAGDQNMIVDNVSASGSHGSFDIDAAAILSTSRFSTNRPRSAIYNFQHDSRWSIISRTSFASNDLQINSKSSSHRGLGFASSLNNMIIREEATLPMLSDSGVKHAIDEAELDDLTLSGPPFAKEGRLYHKFEEKLASRKSRTKGWSTDLFAVLGKGELRLFDFSSKASKSSRKTYGGGDWTENARSLLQLDLTQALSHSLPVGAISAARKHVWQLTAPDGSNHLFQVGTEELVEEWTSTANYWAARVTREPLLGAVDNADYGWGAFVSTELTSLPESSGVPSNSVHYAGDSATLQTWHPDALPLSKSTLPPHEQLLAFQRFIEKLRKESSDHRIKYRLLRQTFSPRHPNLIKALSNHERKEKHLAAQITKFETYIQALESAAQTAAMISSERDKDTLSILSHRQP